MARPPRGWTEVKPTQVIPKMNIFKLGPKIFEVVAMESGICILGTLFHQEAMGKPSIAA